MSRFKTFLRRDISADVVPAYVGGVSELVGWLVGWFVARVLFCVVVQVAVVVLFLVESCCSF